MSAPTTASDIFTDMIATLATPAQWTKGFEARDAAGNSVHYHAPEAVCWCIEGARSLALLRVQNSDLSQQLDDETDELLHQAANGAAPSAVNDDRSTTHDDIVQLIVKASRKA